MIGKGCLINTCNDSLIMITSFLSYKDIIRLYMCSKRFNFCYKIIEKKAIVIQKKFKHHLRGKKKRERLSYTYPYSNKLYYFKPFVICRIFDSSPLYKYRKNNKDFIHKVILNLSVIHNRREESEEDSTLITNIQKYVFEYFLNCNKPVYKNILRELLSMLTINQLSFIR
jgi:hypothetical protein